MNGIVVALLFSLAAGHPASAHVGKREFERRVEASLRMPPCLRPRSYYAIVTHPRPKPAYLRAIDPTIVPFGETGRWKFFAPVKVDLLAVILTTKGNVSLLVFDNFSVPSALRSTVDPAEVVRSLPF